MPAEVPCAGLPGSRMVFRSRCPIYFSAPVFESNSYSHQSPTTGNGKPLTAARLLDTGDFTSGHFHIYRDLAARIGKRRQDAAGETVQRQSTRILPSSD